MNTVLKYPITSLDDHVSLNIPATAQVLTAQMQRGVLTIWALVNPEHLLETRRFRIAGTGHPIDDAEVEGLEHIATVQDGAFVWHVFEVHP